MPGRAVPALEGVVVDERLLNRVQRSPGRQAVSGRDLGAVVRDGRARQESTRSPSKSTMHSPHWPWSQPFFGLVLPSRSRSASSRLPGMPGYFSPSFLASSARPIFDRPGRSRCLAIS
jgi:hypothetical protein